MKKYLLKVSAIEIKGKCPVYKLGNNFSVRDGYILNTNITLCMHSLTSIMPYYIPLSRGITPENLGLGKENRAYVQCLDPCDYTNGGTVVFEIKIEEDNVG